jgi:hypothetical protein
MTFAYVQAFVLVLTSNKERGGTLVAPLTTTLLLANRVYDDVGAAE